MTYRDEDDALRHRVAALESRVQLKDLQQLELRQELATARQELTARQAAAAASPPRTLLLLGVMGAGIALLGNLSWLVGLRPPQLLSLAVSGLASLGLALGLLGLRRLTHGALALVAMILCLVEVSLDPFTALQQQLGSIGGSLRVLSYVKWAIYVGFNVVTALAFLRTRALPDWLRHAACWTLIAAGALSGLQLLALLAEKYELVGQLGAVSSPLHLAASVGLGLVFLKLRR